MTIQSETFPAAERRRYVNPEIGDVAVLLESSEESGGARSLFEIELAPGGGNELHKHLTYGEHFSVVSGRLSVEVDGETRVLAPGESAAVPPKTPHRFFNRSDEPAVFRVELRPGHAGFERVIRYAYGLAADGKANRKGPKNPLHMALLVQLADLRFVGAQTLLEPLVRLLAAVARLHGLERQLERAYPGD